MLNKRMSSAKNIAVKLNPSTLTDHEVKDNKHSGRVDINNLLDRARKVRAKETLTNLVFLGLIVSVLFTIGLILSF